MKNFLLTAFLTFIGIGSVQASEEAMLCMPTPQTRLQKVYVTSDRIILNDNAILYVDYNNYVQTTFGVFVDQYGLFVLSQEPIYTIQPMDSTPAQ